MYRAKDTFWVPGNRRIVKGDLVAETDPAVKGREALFEAVVIPQALADQEQATEPDPGEDLQKEPGPDGAEPTTPADKGDRPSPFDPAEHAAPQVLAYLESADLEEAERVLQAESDGKARTTILTPGGPLLARKEQAQKEGTQ